MIAHSFEDVTTRGNYYPDKRIATAAVSTQDVAKGLEGTNRF
jgi:hypothetical protein